MSFRSPDLLLLLLVVPVAVAVYLRLERRRAHRAAQWSTPALLPNMLRGGPGLRRHVPVALFLTALTLLLVGFARPQAKFSEAKDGATVVLMLDTSGSMAATDVKPSRLRAADAALAAFVKKLPSRYQVALVTFSNHIALTVPPTYDHAAVTRALPKKAALEGTALGDAVQAGLKIAAKAVGPATPGSPSPPATILLVSDGGQNTGQITPAQAAQAALKAKIPVSTVALGTARGVVRQNVPLGGGSGRTFPLVQQVPADATTLKTIARSSGGVFYTARSTAELSRVYKELGSRLVYTKQLREITAGLTGAALVLTVAGALLSGLWFRRLV